jgi:hypothetical protein
MSVKVIALPVLAAGVAVAVFSFVLGRRESPNHRPSVDRMKTEEKRAWRQPTPRRGPSTFEPQQRGALRETVLPLAFWDAALELQADDETERALLPADSREAFDTDQLLDTDDLGAQWVARATRSDDVLDDLNDPAEIPADSVSMISEASRSAASADREEDVEEDSSREVQSSSAHI